MALPADDSAALTDGTHRGMSEDFVRMNGHLWQVYQLARAKGSVYPIVRDRLTTPNDALDGRPAAESQALCGAAATSSGSPENSPSTPPSFAPVMFCQ
ncbi:hypothetical protein [Streptomyces sp. NPDC047043]|uniref:hypothetical protein n=1 Tax=Streptomyces sp. NPDC047043 TaxID=3154497 RepID=UPI0033E61BE7